jgi:8-oxo-dGTP pyrophosphatase MutT (NUDIX family)
MILTGIVLAMQHFIQHLENKLKSPLPGRVAQLKMAHITRRLYVSKPTDARQAGVLALLFPKNEAWYVVLIERNANDRDRHGGQISFPGGKFEPQDKTMLHTALRETEEEVGIPQNEVRVLGSLTDLYIPVSNFQVHPFVGWLEAPPDYRLQTEEVSAVIETPLSHFLNPDARRTTNIPVNESLTLKNVPYFDVEGKTLWGATAMILSELLELCALTEFNN